MIESAVTDLPQPDSPTIPSVLPTSTSNETPSTAWTAPSRVKKYVFRFATSSSAISAPQVMLLCFCVASTKPEFTLDRSQG